MPTVLSRPFRSFAWSGGQTAADVWFWNAGSQPRVLFRASDYADVWSIGSTLVGAVGSSSDYLVDLRTGATTEVPNRVLGPVLNGDALALTRSTSGVTEMSVPIDAQRSSQFCPSAAGGLLIDLNLADGRSVTSATKYFRGGSPDLAIESSGQLYRRPAGPQSRTVTFAVINRHTGQG